MNNLRCFLFCMMLGAVYQVCSALSFVNDMNLQQVCENTKTNEEIYTLSTSGTSGTVTYEIINAASVPFAMVGGTTNTNGKVMLKTELNYENQISYAVTFQARAGSDQVTTTSTVYVKDVNDNPPFLIGAPFVENVLEGSTDEKLLLKVGATDPDNGRAASVTFALQNGDYTKFSISDPSLNGTETVASISIGTDFDFEEIQSYSFEVLAKDLGDLEPKCGVGISLSSTANVYVNVDDAPDTEPQFLREFYSATVQENSRSFDGDLIIQARDGDRGLGWPIEYSLEDGMSLFEIDSATGEISITGDIDRESPDIIDSGTYTLIVEAQENDPGKDTFPGFPGAQNATKAVTITVLDQDDNLPTFYSSSESDDEVTSFTHNISESTNGPVTDFSFSVRDIDQGNNARFKLEVSGDDAEYFQVFPSEGFRDASISLEVVKQLDYETKKILNFEVTATGVEDPKQTTSASFEIFLTDVNDNFPVFEKADYEASVPEHSEPDTEVIVIQATDADDESYGEVTYELLGTTSFGIDGTTGRVFVKDKDLDREERSDYFLTVRVEDGGGLINTTLLTIRLEDINDNEPKFQQSQYLVNWDEGDDSVSPASVSASDLDELGNPNSQLTLEFSDATDSDKYEFADLKGGNGSISANVQPKESLDAETINGSCNNGVIKYSLEISVRDNGSPQLDGTAEVVVFLRDVNDHEPKFGSVQYEGEVPEYSSYDEPIVQISATDNDKCSPNKDLTYVVDPNSFDTEFLIAEEDGNVTLRVKSSELDRNDKETYSVIVLAIDNGQPRKTGSATVVVNITDINNKAPVFDSDESDTSISVAENESAGALIGKLVATDSDEDSDLEYTITKATCLDQYENLVTDPLCDSWFNVTTEDQKGMIYIAGELDREKFEQLILTVQVKDINAEVGDQEISTTVEITIDDYNDNPPDIAEVSEFTVTEELKSGTAIGQLSASDLDTSSQDITFSTENEFVDITDDGELRVKSRIDREGEPGDKFEVVVFASDNGEPELTSNVTVRFAVEDTNDNSPVFENTSYKCEVSEGLDAGSEVCVINATDEDAGENGRVTYSIIPEGSFKIDSLTGKISSGEKFDRETIDSYQLKLKASDSASEGQTRETEVDVQISIKDIDDNAPTYQDFTPQQMNIPENNEAGAEVGIVEKATDIDTEKYQENYYFLVYDAESEFKDTFTLDKMTRNLVVNVALDREETAEYSLRVLTTRNETISSNSYSDSMEGSVLEVNVVVQDENDNFPEFGQKTYTTDMEYNRGPSDSDVIVTIRASDADAGVNADLTYNIVSQNLQSPPSTTTTVDVFSIKTIEGVGNIYLKKAPGLSEWEGKQYVLEVSVVDGGGKEDKATVIVKVFDIVESVVLESLFAVDYLTENEDQLELDLEEALDADVVIDSISAHGSGNDSNPQARASGQPLSDIYFHATVWNESTLVPADDIARALTSSQNENFIAEWGIVSIQDGQPTEEPITEAASLKTVLVIACVVIVVILVVYTLAFVLMRKSYKRKMKAAKASEMASDQTLQNHVNGGNMNIPGTNRHAAGESELYVENQRGNIDMNQLNYRTIHETDSNSIDDNAVDSQDSAISEGPEDPVSGGFDELDDIDIDLEWNNDGSAANLAAALNASKKRGGEEDIILMFDNHGMADDDTAM